MGGVVVKYSQVFDFTTDANGARVTTARDPLTGGCLSDREVDAAVRLLKEDLDAVAKRMKAPIRQQQQRPIFESG